MGEADLVGLCEFSVLLNGLFASVLHGPSQHVIWFLHPQLAGPFLVRWGESLFTVPHALYV